MKIEEIFKDGNTPKQIIDALKYKTVAVPAWAELEKEYDVMKHPVMTDPEYNKPLHDGEQVSKVGLGWQKLAVKRMSGLIFGIPAQRVYTIQNEKGEVDDKLNLASKVLEAIFQKNRINSVNLDRAKDLYASCEFVTIWYGVDSDNALYAGVKAKYKLRTKTYSPMRGDSLYPLFDESGDMIALSVEYATQNRDKKTEVFFDTYTTDKHYRWNTTKADPVLVLDEDVKIEKISGVYGDRELPIWENLSFLPTEAEWTLSRNGNYIRKNARPTFVIATDGQLKKEAKEPTDSRAARNILRVGKGETAQYATWQHASDAIKFQHDTLKREFFTQLQLPDMSMDEMKSAPMSGESRKMLFIDAQMKVTDESGIWLECFDREFEVVRAHACLMFPDLKDAISRIQVEHIITPYQIRDENDKITNITNAKSAGIISTRTAVQTLGWADDVDAEVQQIAKEQTADVFEPTN